MQAGGRVRGTIAIARHEITQRSFLPAAALALGFLPLLVGLLTSDKSQPIDPGVRFGYGAVSVFVSWLAAFVIGISLVGRPLHTGQMGFYFTRPIAGRAIVCGKLLGGVLVIVSAQLLLYVPGAVRDLLGPHREVVSRAGTAALDPLIVVVIGCGFLGIGLVAGVLARSRSRWFLVDLAGVGFVALEIVRIVKQFIAGQELFWVETDGVRVRVGSPPGLPDFQEQFYERFRDLGICLTVAAIVALFAAVTAAVVVGRTDRERAHAAMSTTLWSSLLVIGGLGIAISQWGMP
jgi:ABC-type transport system involved in multi-copper enzyme maturation permease subunit